MKSGFNWEPVLNNMRSKLRDYVVGCNLKSLVLGVSGGIDSALVAAIASPVCYELKIPLIGFYLPTSSNQADEEVRSVAIGHEFCHSYHYYDISDLVTPLISACLRNSNTLSSESLKTRVAFGNIKARIRMIMLFDKAFDFNGMVLGTDVLTELYLGFWTLHGDVGNYGLIQNLWKTEVYDLAQWMVTNENANNKCAAKALTACITATPTDGLGITDSDLEQLGASSYTEVDKILKTWLTNNYLMFTDSLDLKYEGRTEDYDTFKEYRDTLATHPVVQRYERTHFKRQDPCNLSRVDLFAGINLEGS